MPSCKICDRPVLAGPVMHSECLEKLVLDPCGGLGTVALQAVKAGRRGYTIELNQKYFRDAVGYLKELDEREETFSLFDLLPPAGVYRAEEEVLKHEATAAH